MNNTVEICFSPKLYEYRLTKDNFIVVIVDILRATTSICEKAREYKEKGYIVACERDGKVLDFADVGNSPSDFLKDSFRGKTIAYSTTNGTKAINMASDADEIVIGSFNNLTSIANWLAENCRSRKEPQIFGIDASDDQPRLAPS